MHINELPTPALLLDLDILERNLERMQDHANTLNVALRPHIKTHKCIEIGNRQLALGARGITVSTFYEAEQFTEAGFNDITWAFPIPPVYVTKVAELYSKATIRVVIDSLEAKGHLDKAARVTGVRLHAWLKVDCGYHRAGVDPKLPLAEELIKSLSESKALIFDGILTHSGHAYKARSRAEILPYAEQERDVMLEFAGRMRSKGYQIPMISIGSTPALSVIENLDGINEVRVGNYAFYDYTQASIGSCNVSDCALTVLASVISHQGSSSHFVTDAGALALSKDAGPTHVRNDMDMGIIFEDYERKRLDSHLHVRTLSQEHGTVVAEPPYIIDGKFNVGDRVRILEHHSCLTAAQFDKYYVVKEDEVVDEWKILRGR
ncbi:MAG: alanine racemase [Ignavibacteriales bacterium]|nr:alanine racemase [Ignavibacteriales bacterium]MBI3789157.1 alanine racemase [Ignavibacteriales bacterium]